ncbi:MAG: AbrB/MazE/SpoVT family DNA-binding domain-containing protein [Thermoleophilia bacterium]
MSRLTKKYQATIPAPVRKALQLRQGDAIAFDVQEGRVTVRRAEPLDREFARALEDTLGEWLSPEDEEDYRGL